MATGEIRMSILWEWIHKRAALTEADAETGLQAGDLITREFVQRLVEEEFAKLLAADDRDVHDRSKTTTLPIVRDIVEAYLSSEVKLPWYIDPLNLNLENTSREIARQRIEEYAAAFEQRGVRITDNPETRQA